MRNITIDLVTLSERLEQLAKARGLEVRAYTGDAPHAGGVWYDAMSDSFAVRVGLPNGSFGVSSLFDTNVISLASDAAIDASLLNAQERLQRVGACPAGAMLGPSSNFMEVLALTNGERYLVPRSLYPSREELDALALREGERVGLLFQAVEAAGAYLIAENSEGELVQMRRNAFYACAPADEVRAGVRVMVEHIREQLGAGRAWTLAGRVHIIRDDDGAACSDVGVERYVWLRAFVCHEKHSSPHESGGSR